MSREIEVPGVGVLSLTKPKATQDFVCAWGGDTIPKGRLHVRVVWKDRRENSENVKVNSDRFCVDCWKLMDE